MAKVWTYKYGDNTIVVKNTAAEEALYVNDQLQDKKNGIALRSDLTGKLKTGEEIKASLGGMLSVECTLFVDNVLQEPVEVE